MGRDRDKVDCSYANLIRNIMPENNTLNYIETINRHLGKFLGKDDDEAKNILNATRIFLDDPEVFLAMLEEEGGLLRRFWRE